MLSLNHIEEINVNEFRNGPCKLAGMEYHGYKYTAEEWEEKCGVNPNKWPQYFRATKTGLMAITKEFKETYAAYINNHKHNLAALGIKC